MIPAKALLAWMALAVPTHALCTGFVGDDAWNACITEGVARGTLALSSDGGLLTIAEYQAVTVAIHKVPVAVEGYCRSACVPILAASPAPHVGANAHVAVHFVNSHLGNNRLHVRVHDTKASFLRMTGRDDLWRAYLAAMQRNGVLPPNWDGQDFETYAVTKGGSFTERSFLRLDTAAMGVYGLLSGHDPTHPSEVAPF